ncbi:hypothetical protein [Paenibacillus sp. MMO-177]|uniref:hypothetical protein n=1 Tax=Paenibacillus sp. MMO-177 TaxID=3081289 RepID=UPI003019C67F
MIKTEIITDASRYVIDLPGFERLELAYDHVEEQLARSDAAEFRSPEAILCIDLVGSKVKSYRVYFEITNSLYGMVDAPGAAAGLQDGEPYEWFDSVPFLGQTLRVEGLAVDLAGLSYFMPTTINGQAPYDAVSPDNLARLVVTLSQRQEDTTGVLPPPVTLLKTEAIAYLLDFAQQHNADPAVPGEVTARAAGSVLE